MAGQIPRKFVWTKMNTDGGEPLENIVRRKDLERQSGERTFENVFWWGVGESKGEAIRKHLVGKVGNPRVLFSRMCSLPQQRDKEEGGLIWQSYLDDEGNEHSIPDHVIVHSRRKDIHSRPIKSYYAIVCRSPQPLRLSGRASFYASELRNLRQDGTVGKNPGSSQTTLVVDYSPNPKKRIGRPYHDELRADLVGPYFVKLACKKCLTKTEHALFRGIGKDGKTIEDYLSVVGKLRN